MLRGPGAVELTIVIAEQVQIVEMLPILIQHVEEVDQLRSVGTIFLCLFEERPQLFTQQLTQLIEGRCGAGTESEAHPRRIPHAALRGITSSTSREPPRSTLGLVTPSQRKTLAFAALGSLAVCVGLFLLLSVGKSTYLVGTCPAMTSTHFAVIVERQSTTHDDDTRHDASLAVFDLATGALRASVDVGSWRDDAQRAVCFGAAGDAQVWFRPAGAAPSVEVRSVDTGAVVTPFSAFVQANPPLGVGVTALGWDGDRAAPTVSTADGRTLLLDAVTRVASRYEGNVTMTPLGIQADAAIHSRDVDYYLGGLPGLVLADGRRVTLDGHPRSVMNVNGAPLFGERDFLSPHVLLAPASQSIEWPRPPSLIVVEETLVNSLRYRITRIGMDGSVLFSFDPGEALPAATRYRPNPWTSSPDGTLLLHFGGTGVIAIDAVTGVERYRMGYDGEPMERPQ